MSALALSRRKVAKNAVSQIISFGLAGGSRAIAGIMVARALGPDGIGVFSLSWTLAGTLSFLAVLGLDNRLIRELARHGDAREIERSLPLACVLGLGVAGSLFVLPLIIGVGSEVAQALSAAAAFIAISAPVLILRASFHARERMEMETATAIVEGVISLVSAGIALGLGYGVWGAMLGLAAGRLANLVLSLFLYRRVWGPLRMDLSWSGWSRLIHEGWPLAVSYSLTATYLRFDIVVLALVRPPEEVGFYGAASMILLTTPLIAVAFNSSLYPVIARATGPDDPELSAVFAAASRALIVVSVPMAAGLAAMSGDIASMLFGSGFTQAGPLLAGLAWVLPFRFVNHLFGVVLSSSGSKKVTLVSAVLGLNLIVSLALIPIWGAWGALIGTLVTEAALTGALLWAILPLRVELARPLGEAAIVSALVVGAVTITPGSTPLRLVAGACTGILGIATVIGKPGLRALRPRRHDPRTAAQRLDLPPVLPCSRHRG